MEGKSDIFPFWLSARKSPINSYAVARHQMETALA